MSINNGHTPLPNSFLTTINKLGLTHREYRLMIIIGTEIYRFPEGRETLSKELATRYLESLTKIKQNHISRMLNKFHSRGYIKYIKSHIKGQGSIIILTLDTATGSNKLDTAIVSNSMKLDTPTVSNQVKLDTATVSNPINLSIKDHQESDLTDSSINIDQKEENQPEKKDIETSLNSSFLIKDRRVNSKESNSYKPINNLLCPASEAGNSDFSSLGAVLSSLLPSAQDTPVSDPIVSVTPDTLPLINVVSQSAIGEGKEILTSRGFTPAEVQQITGRITDSMKGKDDIKNKSKYFIACCSKETRKNSKVAIHNTSQKIAVPVSKVVNANSALTKKEEIQPPPAVDILERIKTIAPSELYEVVMSVDNDPNVIKSMKFFSSDIVKKEVLASHYVAAFKQRFPDVNICL